VHPGVLMAQSIIAAHEREDRPVARRLAGTGGERRTGHGKRAARMAEGEARLGTNYAGCIAEISVGKGELFTAEGYLRLAGQYVENLFAGPKAGLRPIYDALLAAGLKLGKDVRVCPCKTFVPLYRNHVFAQIKPTTRTRIDLGLALKDTKTPKRLIDTGGFAKKDRITRRIEISSWPISTTKCGGG
jgi:hypothetical protein